MMIPWKSRRLADGAMLLNKGVLGKTRLADPSQEPGGEGSASDARSLLLPSLTPEGDGSASLDHVRRERQTEGGAYFSLWPSPCVLEFKL